MASAFNPAQFMPTQALTLSAGEGSDKQKAVCGGTAFIICFHSNLQRAPPGLKASKGQRPASVYLHSDLEAPFVKSSFHVVNQQPIFDQQVRISFRLCDELDFFYHYQSLPPLCEARNSCKFGTPKLVFTCPKSMFCNGSNIPAL